MEHEAFKRYLSIAIIVLLIGTSIAIAREYIIALISAFILAVLIRPLHVQLSKTLRPSIAAAICVIALLLVIVLPFIFVIGGMVNQLQLLFTTTDWHFYLNLLQQFIAQLNLPLQITQLTQESTRILIGMLTALTARVPALIVALFITALGTYYMLIEWNYLTRTLTKFIPLQQRSHLPAELSKVTRSIIYGTLLIAIIEFLIATLGFALAGVKAYLFLALLIALFAFIPALGPALVWVPLLLILLLQQDYVAAIIVAVTGLIISIYADTILRMQIGGKTTRIHSLVMLVGIFGGVAIFGILGIVIGPLILDYTIKFIESLAE